MVYYCGVYVFSQWNDHDLDTWYNPIGGIAGYKWIKILIVYLYAHMHIPKPHLCIHNPYT